MTAQTVTGTAPSTGDCRPLRYLVVGAGNRCEMYLRSLLEDHADAAVLVGIGDTNPGRAEYYRAFAAALGLSIMEIVGGRFVRVAGAAVNGAQRLC